MIDVFMLAREQILKQDNEVGKISGVVFCEVDQEQYTEIIDMLGTEGSGFQRSLEDLVLFADDTYTAQFPTIESLKVELEDEGVQSGIRDRLQLKEQHLSFRDMFPFDFINLDFCDYYYPMPPDVLQKNRTVENVVDLQTKKRKSTGSDLREFILSVTCRFDEGLPPEALDRLEDLVAENTIGSALYSTALRGLKGTDNVHKWCESDSYDFFVSAWPKEILRMAKDKGWNAEILDIVWYDRTGDSGRQYKIVCLIVLFASQSNLDGYIAEAARVLDPTSRTLIGPIDRNTKTGRVILENLRDVVRVRNERAMQVGRPTLPDP
jgi:hypothetical protein